MIQTPLKSEGESSTICKAHFLPAHVTIMFSCMSFSSSSTFAMALLTSGSQTMSCQGTHASSQHLPSPTEIQWQHSEEKEKPSYQQSSSANGEKLQYVAMTLMAHTSRSNAARFLFEAGLNKLETCRSVGDLQAGRGLRLSPQPPMWAGHPPRRRPWSPSRQSRARRRHADRPGISASHT